MSYPTYYPIEGDTLPHLFDTFDGGDGSSITMSDLAVTDIEIYKDGGTTQRSSDAGYTLLDTDGIDFDSITGIHGFSIDLSDNTDAGFYEVGPWYHVVVSSITVDSQTVNFVACAFRILDATRGMAGTALPDAAADAAGGLPISDAGGLDIDAKLANTNEVTAARMGALTDWINGGRLDLILDIIAADVVNVDGSSIPTVAQIQAEMEENGASILDTIRDDLADGGRLDLIFDAIKAKTDNLPADPADDSDIDTQLAAIKAETALIVADTNELQTDDIPGTLATIAGYLDTEIAAILEDTGTTLPATLASILEDTGTTLPATLATIAGYLDTEIAAILADTNELQTDWANGGRLDLLIDAILEDTGTTIPALIAALNNISVANITGAEVDNDGTAISIAGAFKLILAVLTGKSSGGGGATIVFRDINDAKNRISATVDANGNRTAVGTRDAT